MSAFEIPNLRFSFEAGAAVARRRFVKVNASEQGVQAAAGDRVIGASMVDAKTGEVLEIADGIVMVEAGAALGAGVPVKPDASGKAIAMVVDDTAPVAGITVTAAAAAGELISVKI